MTLFELGYLDLFKALFLGKKISLTPGNGGFFMGSASAGISAGNVVGGSHSNFVDEDSFSSTNSCIASTMFYTNPTDIYSSRFFDSD